MNYSKGTKVAGQNLLKELETTLKKEKGFVSDDGKLLKNSIIEAGLHLNPSLLKLLIENKVTKQAFFAKVGSALVFDKIAFQKFVSNKQFLADSYTIFKNKVGLSDGGDGYLKQKNDVVLNWAYKDCVLEGGMRKEKNKNEKTKNRDEIFYNTILAPNEITRLYAPKVFTNFEKWDVDSVKKNKAKKVTEIKDTDNLLIKGNNLLALHCLKERYAGKVKLIYIDPPYNTNTDASSFLYNNNFNHSTWLTFMKNRLEVAKFLLREDGIFVIDIDHYELFYLGVMCDEIFGINNRLGILAVQHNPGGRDADFFAISHENKIVYAVNKELAKSKFYGLPITEKDMKKYTKKDNISEYKFRALMRTGDNSRKEDCPTLWFPLFVNKKTKEISVNKKTEEPWIELYPIDNNGIKRCWRWGKESITKKWKTELVVVKNETEYQIYSKDRPKDRKKSKTLWVGSKYAGATGTSVIKKMFESKIFTYPKSPFQISDILELTTKEGDLVLDFFGGSGTTFDVVHKMRRQWIGIEQMDYVENVTKERLKKVINGDQTGISEEVNWKGGGEFIYCELKEWNEKYIQEIRKAKTKADVKKIHETIKREAFYRYDVNMDAYDGKDFDALSLKEQMDALCNCLDVNHLYVNYSERDDNRYEVTDEEKRLTKKFYGK